jgi:hypothetical protein
VLLLSETYAACTLYYLRYSIALYRSIILPFVLYGCETWSFASREERRLCVFENGGAEKDICGLNGTK